VWSKRPSPADSDMMLASGVGTETCGYNPPELIEGAELR
jgi:hypothetical protein